jgi:hypothetical protein
MFSRWFPVCASPFILLPLLVNAIDRDAPEIVAQRAILLGLVLSGAWSLLAMLPLWLRVGMVESLAVERRTSTMMRDLAGWTPRIRLIRSAAQQKLWSRLPDPGLAEVELPPGEAQRILTRATRWLWVWFIVGVIATPVLIIASGRVMDGVVSPARSHELAWLIGFALGIALTHVMMGLCRREAWGDVRRAVARAREGAATLDS